MRLKNAPGFITICQMMSDKFEQKNKVCGMIYFTSDLHLGHRGIIEMQNCPFENLEKMHSKKILIKGNPSLEFGFRKGERE